MKKEKVILRMPENYVYCKISNKIYNIIGFTLNDMVVKRDGKEKYVGLVAGDKVCDKDGMRDADVFEVFSNVSRDFIVYDEIDNTLLDKIISLTSQAEYLINSDDKDVAIKCDNIYQEIKQNVNQIIERSKYPYAYIVRKISEDTNSEIRYMNDKPYLIINKDMNYPVPLSIKG